MPAFLNSPTRSRKNRVQAVPGGFVRKKIGVTKIRFYRGKSGNGTLRFGAGDAVMGKKGKKKKGSGEKTQAQQARALDAVASDCCASGVTG